ncbi:Uncharacterised protein [Mycobacteroides abscessus subsp. abscessus]|nr:Uncharacterised protein [Mycobacteroides abscessus subsp. abscessus]
MAEPVVHLELNPRRRKCVEGCRRYECVSGEQTTANRPRVGLHQAIGRFRKGLIQRCIASESAAHRPHEWVIEIVVGAVNRAGSAMISDTWVVLWCVECPASGVEQVVRLQRTAQRVQHRDPCHFG